METKVNDDDRSVAPKRLAAVVLSDVASGRAMEAICQGLDVDVVRVDEQGLTDDQLDGYEVIIGDEAVLRRLRKRLSRMERPEEWIKPALVAVGPQVAVEAEEGHFDAVLTLPATPADLAARLSVVLYSHRALAQRYQSALDELKLNRNIFRSVTNGISVADARLPDMPLTYVNPAFELMTGYSMEDVQGKNCRFLQGNERDQPGLTLIREAIRQERQTVAVIRNFRRDGSSFWNELTLSPIRNREGVVTHFVGIQMDVTDRVEMEGALRQSEKLAAVGRLASAISHEINNPLEAVMNLLYLAEQAAVRTVENAESRKYLQQADAELQRVKQITAQSLRFYKQSSVPEAVLVGDLVTSVLDVYRARLLNYGVEVKVRGRSTQHIVGLGSELRQVLSNLVSNALDAVKSKSGAGRLRVRTREATRWATDSGGVLVTVADNGTGIPAAVMEKIYTAFYTTKGVGGTGLGLWISSEIVARHRGHLKVRSRTTGEKSYTVFQLFLPFQGPVGEVAER